MPSVLEPPQIRPLTEDRQSTLVHRIAVNVMRLAMLVAIAGTFGGLVAQNVRIFDYKSRENTLAVISEISLDINYAALIHHEPFLNALDVRNAQITLPLKGAAGKIDKAQLNNFRAHVYFPPEQ